MRRMRHPFRLTSRIVTLVWLWRNRHDLIRWARFVARVPTDIQARGFEPVLAEARVRLALTVDPRTRAARDLDIARVEDGTVVVSSHEETPIGLVAREVLTLAPGVDKVRFVDPTRDAPPTADPYELASSS
jgi:hypothetical protein